MPATPAPPTGFTPVTLKQHGNRFWRRPRGYGFAAGWAHIPLCMAEVAHMAALLPLAFAPIKPGGSRLGPVALCGPETAPPLCPETGAWRLPYVPAILRAYPFHVRQTAQQQLELWVYDSPETLSGVPTDQPFFGPDGQPAQQLEDPRQPGAQFLSGHQRADAGPKRAARHPQLDIAARSAGADCL